MAWLITNRDIFHLTGMYFAFDLYVLGLFRFDIMQRNIKIRNIQLAYVYIPQSQQISIK